MILVFCKYPHLLDEQPGLGDVKTTGTNPSRRDGYVRCFGCLSFPVSSLAYLPQPGYVIGCPPASLLFVCITIRRVLCRKNCDNANSSSTTAGHVLDHVLSATWNACNPMLLIAHPFKDRVSQPLSILTRRRSICSYLHLYHRFIFARHDFVVTAVPFYLVGAL